MKKIVLTMMAAVAAVAMQAEAPKVIAHRGYWDTEGSAQNSIRSLVKADSIGCYASEFDVWITADDVLVVNHDGNIDEVVIEKAPAAEVLAKTLRNGEHVPTLEAYFQEAVKHPNLRLVCEVKPHVDNDREGAAIQGILDMVEKYGLGDRIDYITFSKNGLKKLIKFAPASTEVYYLDGDYIPSQIKYAKSAGIDYSLKVMKKHPEWIKQCHDKGLKVNVWTVNKEEDMKWCIDNGVDFITTNDPELLQKLIK